MYFLGKLCTAVPLLAAVTGMPLYPSFLSLRSWSPWLNYGRGRGFSLAGPALLAWSRFVMSVERGREEDPTLF
jgi:hypothetical protein